VGQTLKLTLARPISSARLARDGETKARRPSGALQAGAPSSGQAGVDTDPQARIDAQCAALRCAKTALEDAANKLTELQEKVLADAEKQVVDLALEIAQKVLMQEVQAGRYSIEPIVKEALLHVPPRQDVVIHLHPQDIATCEMARSDEKTSQAGSIRFVADRSIQPGGCVLETSEGIVESSIDKHIQNVSQALREQD